MTEKEILKEKLEKLSFIVENISDIIIDSEKENLEAVKNKLTGDNSVSIGITGVIKAGKSTLLNAILQKDILGTAIVPETANLTTIKYAKEEKATILFWNKKEWNEIIENSKTDENLKEWLEKTNDAIDNISAYITEDGKKEDIGLDELPKYTSAKKKYGSLCNIVKNVELYTPLKYLEDGVEIIDTPGIDDPVVRREQITQEFLTDCDIMVHCMNAGNAFSAKDASFVIDNIVSKNIYKLLFVFTRIDTLSNIGELESIIQRAKDELKTKFEQYKDGNEFLTKKFSNILDRVEVVAVSGKDALNHRIGKESKTNLSLEDSHIDELEIILDRLLFEENPKYKILFSNSKENLLDIAKQSIIFFNEQESLKSKSLEELKEQIEKLKENKKSFEQSSIKLIEKIKTTKKDFQTSLQQSANNSLSEVSNIEKKVFNEVERYLYKIFADGDKPEEDKIKDIIETIIKSNIMEIIEKHQESILNNMTFYLKDISNSYKNSFDENIFDNIEQYNFNFDRLFGDGFLAKSMILGASGFTGFGATLLSGILIANPITAGAIGIGVALGGKAILSTYTENKKNKEIAEIMKKVENSLSKIFKDLNQTISETLNKSEIKILKEFDEISLKPYNEIKNKLNELEKSLNKQIVLVEEDTKNLEEYQKNIRKKWTIFKENIKILEEL